MGMKKDLIAEAVDADLSQIEEWILAEEGH